MKYADISMNTEVRTIELLSAEAKKQGKTHKIIIMVELGELREGVIGEKLLSFYKKISTLDNIEIIGIGSNLSCLYGVLPDQDKLDELIRHKEAIETRFRKKNKIPFRRFFGYDAPFAGKFPAKKNQPFQGR